MRIFKKILKYLAIFLLVSSIIVIGTNIYIQSSVSFSIRSFHSIQSLEHRKSALILGAGLWNSGTTPSHVLQDRLDIGYELMKNGKVDYLILSGDNSVHTYNEPDVMKNYLIKKGIPQKYLIPDYAGRRTYDSCYRARDIFGQNRIYVVTQDFHLTRSVFLCQQLGIDTLGVNSDLRSYRGEWYNKARDYLGMMNALVDLYILKPKPILGEEIDLDGEKQVSGMRN